MNKIISFGIYANQTDKRWNTFIEEMDTLSNLGMFERDRNREWYFGLDKKGLPCISTCSYHYRILITLDDYFAEGSVYRVAKDGSVFPTRGTKIICWDEEEDYQNEYIALTYIEGTRYPVVSAIISEFESGNIFDTYFFKHWKPLPKENPERQKLQQEIEQLEKELQVKRDKLKEV